MKLGMERSPLRERGDDLYETPAIAVHALLRVEPTLAMSSRIWEPCAGRGAIARVLAAAGHDVVCSDLRAYDGADPGIESRVDFLLEPRAPEGIEAIITNPPFKLADDFIHHGLSLVPRVIVLLRLMALEGSGRSALIDHHLVRLWAGIERLPPMHREGWTGKKLTNSGAPFAWFVFEASPRGDKPIDLRRMSWEGRNYG